MPALVVVPDQPQPLAEWLEPSLAGHGGARPAWLQHDHAGSHPAVVAAGHPAALRAPSQGIERYLPLGVGVVVVGMPLIGVAWLAHLLLGIPTWAAGLASLARILIMLLRGI